MYMCSCYVRGGDLVNRLLGRPVSWAVGIHQLAARDGDLLIKWFIWYKCEHGDLHIESTVGRRGHGFCCSGSSFGGVKCSLAQSMIAEKSEALETNEKKTHKIPISFEHIITFLSGTMFAKKSLMTIIVCVRLLLSDNCQSLFSFTFNIHIDCFFSVVFWWAVLCCCRWPIFCDNLVVLFYFCVFFWVSLWRLFAYCLNVSSAIYSVIFIICCCCHSISLMKN
jgi:hypothetical protein